MTSTSTPPPAFGAANRNPSEASMSLASILADDDDFKVSKEQRSTTSGIVDRLINRMGKNRVKTNYIELQDDKMGVEPRFTHLTYTALAYSAALK